MENTTVDNGKKARRRMLGIKEASKELEISTHELRTGAISGKYPHFRLGGERGKIIFDIELLEEHILQMMKDNVKRDEEEPAYGTLRSVNGNGR